MATPTYTALATFTATGTESSVTFGSIPSGYRDVIIQGGGSGSTTSPVLEIRVNSDSGSNYSYVYMLGTGSSALSGSSGDNRAYAGEWGGTAESSCYVQFMDYSATDKHKTILSRAGNPGNRVDAFANRWANTSAITTIECYLSSGTFNAGTTLSLYGIAS